MLSSGPESNVTETWWSFACQFGYHADLDDEYNTTSLIYPASQLPLLLLRRKDLTQIRPESKISNKNGK
jgi:hypothetical protein